MGPVCPAYSIDELTFCQERNSYNVPAYANSPGRWADIPVALHVIIWFSLWEEVFDGVWDTDALSLVLLLRVLNRKMGSEGACRMEASSIRRHNHMPRSKQPCFRWADVFCRTLCHAAYLRRDEYQVRTCRLRSSREWYEFLSHFSRLHISVFSTAIVAVIM